VKTGDRLEVSPIRKDKTMDIKTVAYEPKPTIKTVAYVPGWIKPGELPLLKPTFTWSTRDHRKEDRETVARVREMFGGSRKFARLFTYPGANTKLAKGEGLPVLGLTLSPGDESKNMTCPSSTRECRAYCLNNSGRYAMPNARISRLWKTHLLFNFPDTFARVMALELYRFAQANPDGYALRMNVLSDLPFHRGQFHRLIEEAGQTKSGIFHRYEYTKVKKYFTDSTRVNFTYSARGPRLDDLAGEHIQGILYNGGSVAVVADSLPRETLLYGFDWIDGDEDDRRYLNPGKFVILKPKGTLPPGSSFVYSFKESPVKI